MRILPDEFHNSSNPTVREIFTATRDRSQRDGPAEPTHKFGDTATAVRELMSNRIIFDSSTFSAICVKSESYSGFANLSDKRTLYP